MRTPRLLAVILLLCACTPPPPLTLSQGDYAVQFTPADGALRLLRRGEELLRFPADAFQVATVPALDPRTSYDPYWLEYGADILPVMPLDDLRWHVLGQATASLSNETLSLDLRSGDGPSARLDIAAPPGGGHFAALLRPDPGATGRAIAFIRLRPRASGPESGEGLYGLGEWEDQAEHRGTVRPMQMEFDGMSESSDNEDHVPVPLLIGTRGWGLFIESRRLGVFDVAAKERDLIEITYGTAEQSAQGLRFHLFSTEDPLDVPRLYYGVTGLPLLPAQWALGPWFWRDEARDQAQVLDDLEKIRTLDLATSGIWLDRPYATAVNTFDYSPAKFTDPAMMIQAIHDHGLGMAVWSTPYLEQAAQPLHDMAVKAGYFPPKSGLLTNGWGPPIDFTNPAAYAFWQGLIHRYTGMGVAGFKLDYGEDVVADLGMGRDIWRFADGSDERTMHHGYTLLYHKVYAETLPKTGGYLLCRAGRWGDQTQVSVILPGDMDATFTRHGERFIPPGDKKEVTGVGGLPATVVMGLSLSASGFPFFAADTGGYRHSPADKELFIRWFEQTALSAVMNVGDASSQAPWEFTMDNGRDAETLDLYRAYARLHMRLFPYEWTYAQALLDPAQGGRPILRALGLAHPELRQHPSDTYLFGDDLLVAPVLARGMTTRQVLLPAGDWYDYWDGTVYAGGGGGQTVTVPAPLGTLPLLARAGTILPHLRPTILTMAPAAVAGIESFANQPGLLYVRLFPPVQDTQGRRFTVYDGSDLQQQRQGLLWQVSARGGSVFSSGMVLEFVRSPRPQAVTQDGAALAELASPAAAEASNAGWAWDSTGSGALWVKVPGGQHAIEARYGP